METIKTNLFSDSETAVTGSATLMLHGWNSLPPKGKASGMLAKLLCGYAQSAYHDLHISEEKFDIRTAGSSLCFFQIVRVLCHKLSFNSQN
uniref:Uncharacterized protein n=1 Tax=Steinernema glaseri TaxID=37863 RepID=A0A1I7ZU57_9BILA